MICARKVKGISLLPWTSRFLRECPLNLKFVENGKMKDDVGGGLDHQVFADGDFEGGLTRQEK